MVVLHVLEALRGGTSRHLLDVVEATPGVEHHLALPRPGRQAWSSGAALDEDALEALRRLASGTHHLDMRRSAAHPANLAGAAALRRLIRSLRPDLVHGHSAVGGALARLAAASTRVASLYTPNGLPTGRTAIALERRLGRLTSALVAVSPSEALLAEELGLVPPERIHVIPNGIDLAPRLGPPLDLREHLGLDAATPLVGTVARLVAQKNPVSFVEVCAEVSRQRPEAHFLLIGMGPLQGRVDRAVDRLGLGGRWHQVPRLPQVARVLGQLDVFVLASAWEGAPYTPLEAMRAGTPVVLSDVVGNRDAIEHGVSGLLGPPGDAAALAEGVVWLLSDPQARRAMVEAASLRVAERFDRRSMGASLACLYQAVASAKSTT